MINTKSYNNKDPFLQNSNRDINKNNLKGKKTINYNYMI